MSKLTLFSMGYISTSKLPDTKYVRVIPIETTPQLDGIIDDGNVSIEFEGIDEDGEIFAGSLDTSAAIVAEWIGSDSQRMTAPNVKKGEVVYIYKYGDNDRYFWETRNVKSHLRDQEHIVYLVAAKKDNDRTFLTITNSYSITVSSREQRITINLTDANTEKSSYTFELNGAKAVAFLKDNKGQSFSIESVLNKITLINKQKSKVVLDKENIFIKNKGNLTDETTKNVSFTCTNYILNSETYTANVKGKYDIITDAYSIDATSVKVKANTTDYDCPKSTFSGMVQTGPLTCASLSIAPPPSMLSMAKMSRAGISSSAICKIKGDLEMEGNLIFKSGNLMMGGGNITGVGSLSGDSASFSSSCTAPNIP